MSASWLGEFADAPTRRRKIPSARRVARCLREGDGEQFAELFSEFPKRVVDRFMKLADRSLSTHINDLVALREVPAGNAGEIRIFIEFRSRLFNKLIGAALRAAVDGFDRHGRAPVCG